jgi:NAD(P)-dependent dehydrogenase (short-subunit alcohol dehydrogenase family)
MEGARALYDFHGRTGIVTGAGSGIGRATALLLAKSGATVLGVGRQAGPLDETATLARGYEGRILPRIADVTDEKKVSSLVAETEKNVGPISFQFNNAGIGGAHKTIVDLSLAELDEIMNVSFRAVFIGMKYALPAMKRAGGGAVVNCGSLLSFKGAVRRGDYAMAKHAVMALTKTAAGEHAKDNIQVNCVCPGPIDTPLQHQSEVLVNPKDPSYERRRYEVGIPMGRYGAPEEVAEVVAFLMSGAAPYLTGAAIPLDGAFLAV